MKNIYNSFFEPFVGRNYEAGINGKKILVMGASFYCSKVDCAYFDQCTDTHIKDSARFNQICPEYVKDGKLLCREPTYVVEEQPRTLSIFSKLMSEYTGKKQYSETWSYMAFTNYVQFFLPANGKKFRTTNLSDVSDRDFKAFIETLKQLQPDVIIVWGCVTNTFLINSNSYVTDKDKFEENEWYMCHMRHPDVSKEITLINPYHPSSSAWYEELPVLKKYLDKAFDITNNIK